MGLSWLTRIFSIVGGCVPTTEESLFLLHFKVYSGVLERRAHQEVESWILEEQRFFFSSAVEQWTSSTSDTEFA